MKVCEFCKCSYQPSKTQSKKAIERQKFCSRTCLYDSMRGSNARWWKGGRLTAGHQGYVMVYAPWHPASQKRYIQEHRLVMEEFLGRQLYSWEEVHHINGIRSDNRLENLQLRTTKHGGGIALCCADCGSHNIVATEISGG